METYKTKDKHIAQTMKSDTEENNIIRDFTCKHLFAVARMKTIKDILEYVRIFSPNDEAAMHRYSGGALEKILIALAKTY